MGRGLDLPLCPLSSSDPLNLLQYVIGMCPLLQIKNLFAILIDSNQDSIRLLEKYDFEKWGHMPRVAEFDGIEVGHLYYGLRIEKC